MYISDEIKEDIKARIDIVAFISRYVTIKKQGRNFVGCCPFHTEKTGSFTVSPEKQIYHCFGCGSGGDIIKFLLNFSGRPFPLVMVDLAAEAGISIPDAPEGYRPPRRKLTIPKEETKEMLKARETRSPKEIWQKQASDLVDKCHKALLVNKEQLAYLASRGVSIDAVRRFKLGWRGKEDFQTYPVWGFKPEKNDKKNWRKVWLPKGIVIPCFIGSEIHNIRIRRDYLPGGDNMGRYIIVKGSGNATMIIPRSDGRSDTACIVIEAELDAIAVADVAGDLVTIIGNGNTTARPDKAAVKVLNSSPHILCAFDFDNAGEKASWEWQKNYREAISWPVPEAKDPGEYVKDCDGDIRAWVLAGLPPGLRVCRKLQEPEAARAGSSLVKQKDAETPQKVEPLYISMESKCGRDIYITGDRETKIRLEDERKIVFSYQEMDKVKLALSDAEDINFDISAATFIDIKEIMGGRIIGRVDL